MSTGPMHRKAAIEASTPGIADIRADLGEKREALERMHGEVGELLEQADQDASVDDAAEGLKEVWARLAIARSAAQARFH